MPRKRLVRNAYHKATPPDAELLARPASEMNVVSQAEALLRTRLSTRPGFRLLDGTPCDLNRLMREANAVLASHGLAQLGRNPAWHV
ncbi:MAG: hypothetical protein BGO49_24375 [Planctomycetales bacterium 71-10]|nr:MAG: hypothetical protein BGO49_24375 [Planctomycetales bacterium 71-10]